MIMVLIIFAIGLVAGLCNWYLIDQASFIDSCTRPTVTREESEQCDDYEPSD